MTSRTTSSDKVVMTKGRRGRKRKADADTLILTPRQVEILRLIRDYRQEHGCSPTMQEMAEELEISKVTVFEHVEALIRKGLLRREANRARSLTLDPRLKLKGQEQAKQTKKQTKQKGEAVSEEAGAFPLAGTVAAGMPLEAIEATDLLDVPALFRRKGQVYALQVRGDSMIEDHIQDGDYVLVEKTQQARDGQTVVAVLENGEATLKRLYREGDGFRLQGANPEFKAMKVKEVDVRGVVVGVVRRC